VANRKNETKTRIGVSEGTDNTARKLAEEALLQAGALQRAIFNSANFSSIATDAKGVIQIFNVGAERMLGYTATEVMNKITPADISDPQEVIARAEALSVELGTPITPGFEALVFKASRGIEDIYELTYIRKDGSRFPVVVSVTALRDAQDAIIGYLLIGTDNTARKLAEEALLKAGAELAAMQTAVSEAAIVAITDVTGKIEQVNDNFVRISKYSREELVGQDHRLLNSGLHPKEFIRDLWVTIANGKVWRNEFRNRAKDGSLYWVDTAITPIRNEHGKVIKYMAVRFDVTARKEAEEQLRGLQKREAIGQLTGGVAHDFNNLLAIVRGNLELLREKLTSQPDLLSFAEKSLRAVERGATLTRSLLAFSRQQPLSPKPVDVRKLLQDVSDLVRRTVPENIEIEVIAGIGLWNCEADPGQLQNAVLNLITNARDSMPDGGRMTIETSNASLDDRYAAAIAEVEPGRYVTISVSDTGHGMSPEVAARAFDPFFTTKEIGKGSGLGLSMVYGFAKQSNGYVKIYSEVDHGTTLRIYLPRSTASVEEATREPSGDSIRSNGETILVVEDDADVRSMTVSLLRSMGYGVLEAEGPQRALLLAQENPHIALLLTDVVLPGGMNGRQSAEEILRKIPHLKVLYMSGYTYNAIEHQGRLEPDVHFLQKPFGKRELGLKVRVLLDAEEPK
jgi:PAS domain S-box-containing protein